MVKEGNDLKAKDEIEEEKIITLFIQVMIVYTKVSEELVTFIPSHQGEGELLKGFLSKILVHSGSAYQLYEGTYQPNPFFSVHTIDASSIMVLARATLEAYISFFYTFIDPQTEDELIFRLQYFQYRGLVARIPLNGTSEAAKRQMQRDKVNLKEHFKIICSTAFYKNLVAKEKDRVEKGIYSFNITQTLQRTGFSELTSKVLYGFLSGHAHSGYLSLLQILQMRDSQLQRRGAFYGMWIITIVLGLTTKSIINKFPQAKLFIITQKEYGEVINEVTKNINIFDGDFTI